MSCNTHVALAQAKSANGQLQDLLEKTVLSADDMRRLVHESPDTGASLLGYAVQADDTSLLARLLEAKVPSRALRAPCKARMTLRASGRPQHSNSQRYARALLGGGARPQRRA